MIRFVQHFWCDQILSYHGIMTKGNDKLCQRSMSWSIRIINDNIIILQLQQWRSAADSLEIKQYLFCRSFTKGTPTDRCSSNYNWGMCVGGVCVCVWKGRVEWWVIVAYRQDIIAANSDLLLFWCCIIQIFHSSSLMSHQFLLAPFLCKWS